MQGENNGSLPSGVPVRYNFSFAANTTYGCGGIAKAALCPRSEKEGALAFSRLLKSGKRFCVLGGGSNVLAQDGFYDGYVLSTSHIKSLSVRVSGEDFALNVSCGVKVAEVLAFCLKEGYSGLEFLAGIPASMGGVLYMNAGAGGEYIESRVLSVRLSDGDKVRVLSRKECNFTYKHSTMRDINCLILGAELALKHTSAKNVAANIKKRLSERGVLPRGKSCGCVFENYCGVSAGRLIEDAGLKGAHMGSAFISEKHANFIINEGKASSDVYALIQQAKREVYNKFGITLREEVCYIGDFE